MLQRENFSKTEISQSFLISKEYNKKYKKIKNWNRGRHKVAEA